MQKYIHKSKTILSLHSNVHKPIHVSLLITQLSNCSRHRHDGSPNVHEDAVPLINFEHLLDVANQVQHIHVALETDSMV